MLQQPRKWTGFIQARDLLITFEKVWDRSEQGKLVPLTPPPQYMADILSFCKAPSNEQPLPWLLQHVFNYQVSAFWSGMTVLLWSIFTHT